MLCTYILVYSEQDDEMRAQETAAVAINCQGKSENYFICVLGRKGGAKGSGRGGKDGEKPAKVGKCKNAKKTLWKLVKHKQ